MVSDELVVRAAQVVGSGTKGLPAHLRLTKERRKAHPAVETNFERSDSDGAKKTKKRVQYLKISSDDLWRVRDKLDGKKRSLVKTYKTSKETNDKVYALNQQTGKYLENLAILYENFEQACTERKEAEEQFDKDFHEMLENWRLADQGVWKHRLPTTELRGTSMRGWVWSAISSRRRPRRRCP